LSTPSIEKLLHLPLSSEAYLQLLVLCDKLGDLNLGMIMLDLSLGLTIFFGPQKLIDNALDMLLYSHPSIGSGKIPVNTNIKSSSICH